MGLAVVIEFFCQPEVGHLGGAVGREQHVGRFEVSMHDVGLVGGVHGASQRVHDFGRLARRLRSAVQLSRQAPPRAELEAQKREPVVFPNFVNLDDIRMLQTRDRFGFDAETVQIVLAGVAPRQNDLERHDPVEFSLAGLIHDPHASPRNLAQDIVAAKRLLRSELRVAAAPRPVRQRPGDQCGAEASRIAERGWDSFVNPRGIVAAPCGPIGTRIPRGLLVRHRRVRRRSGGRRNLIGTARMRSAFTIREFLWIAVHLAAVNDASADVLIMRRCRATRLCACCGRIARR